MSYEVKLTSDNPLIVDYELTLRTPAKGRKQTPASSPKADAPRAEPALHLLEAKRAGLDRLVKDRLWRPRRGDATRRP